MKRTLVSTTLAAALVALMSACTTTSPDVVQRGDAQRLSSVQDATVLSVRPVTVEGSQSGVGAATGGVLGGLAGSSRSSGRESVAIGVIGAVAGAVAGHAVERAATKEDAVEILLQMRSGERRAIVQARAGETFQAGDPVILVTTAGKTRVTKAPAGTQPVAPVPAPVYKPEGRPS
jgi:outer membrane lipoprotein SlyB